ncbi:MAG: SPASM domain-containing protein [archaeon]
MIRRPCSGLWKYKNIGWDGVVTVCCLDPERELAIGNVKDTPLDLLWQGKKISQYRIWHILGQFDQMPKCMFCNNLDSPKISDDEIVEYLREIKRDDLIGPFLKRMKNG